MTEFADPILRPVAPLDQEALFGFVASGSWSEALALLRGAPADWARHNPVAGHAGDLLLRELAAAVPTGRLNADDLELIVMLGRAGRLPVPRDFEALVIEALLGAVRDDPGRALSVARFRPDLPTSASVIAQYGIPERQAGVSGALRTQTVESSHGTVDAGRSAFRSPRERAFFEAAVRVFNRDLVCPNVSLNAALDFERLRSRLAASERRVFFTALVDCVVFDRSADYAPKFFFELDSKVHDDHLRSEKDGIKDRIVALAGFRLTRIRPGIQSAESGAYEAFLRSLS